MVPMHENQALVEYLRRSYTAVDGLWFVMVEEAHDFDHALALDERVWQILPKIQARKAREVLGITGFCPRSRRARPARSSASLAIPSLS